MDNIYKTPEATLIHTEPQTAPFFVTGIGKMCLLYVATLGMYGLYWFYKLWAGQRHSLGKKISPLWRAFFPMFYVHSLCRLIAQRLADQQQLIWPYRRLATSMVVLIVSSWGWSVMVDTADKKESLAICVTWLFLAAQLLPMVVIQRKANLASNDPMGTSNSALSVGNVIWLLFGLLLWAGIIQSLRAV